MSSGASGTEGTDSAGPPLGERLRLGERLYGFLVVSPSPHWPAAVRATGADVVFIDTEHIALDRHQLSWMCQAYSALGIAPVVRVPEPEPYRVTEYLDGGAVGIVAPYVETEAQVRQLVGATKLRPLKGARLDEALDAYVAGKPLSSLEWCDDSMAAHIEGVNKEHALIINIESQPAIDNLDKLLAYPIDAVLIGPHDLSVNLGVPRQWDHPKFLAACKHIMTTARAAGKGAGNHYSFDAAVPLFIEWIKDCDANLIMCGSDVKAMSAALKSDLDAIKAGVGDVDAAAAGDDAGVEEAGIV